MSDTPISSKSKRTTIFTKQELYEELAWFLPAYVRSFARLLGSGAIQESFLDRPDQHLALLQATPVWRSLDALYHYGVHGVLPKDMQLGDGSLADVELFIGGIAEMGPYLGEDDGQVPVLSVVTVAIAQARMVLDGEAAYEVRRMPPAGYISVPHVALLCRCPEQAIESELNADSNQARRFRVFDGIRHMDLDDARSFARSCMSFVPTGTTAPPFNFAKQVHAELPVDVLRAVAERAAATGTTQLRVLRQAFAAEISRDQLYAPPAVAGCDAQGEQSLPE